jgi:hypothetical protein
MCARAHTHTHTFFLSSHLYLLFRSLSPIFLL